MQIDDIKNVLIVGAGNMGSQIGLQCAASGYRVTLYDTSPTILDASKTKICQWVSQLVEKGRLSSGDGQSALTRLVVTTDLKAAGSEADLLSESVPEDPALKGQLFARFNEVCPPHTIFTTNTSTLLPSMLAAATGRPSRFAALHFHPVVWEVKLVEIMPHKGTSKTVLDILKSFAKAIAQIPIVLGKESLSYIFNAMLNAINSTALGLASDGITSAEDIDRAWMIVTGMGIGPFGKMDFIGLDVVYQVINYWGRATGNQRQLANARFIRKYLDQGRLGVKSGAGIYTYPNPAYERPDFTTADYRSDAIEREEGNR